MMAADPTAETAHAPTGAVYGSDFGLMLAWADLVQGLALERDCYAVICDDPWVFRHLSTLSGVHPVKPPGLLLRKIKLIGRGIFVRLAVSVRMLKAYLQLKRFRRVMQGADRVILVYGHPHSNAEGYDDYFGNMMELFPNIKRLLHADCSPTEALRLCADGRSAPVHAWGSAFGAVSLLKEYWFPGKDLINGEFGWIIRRAADQENGGGSAPMIRWQMLCQRRWLKDKKPGVVVWPWENFAWERDLCRRARVSGVSTAGYQHTAIGPHQINHSPNGNPDGLYSFPDEVISDGPAYFDQLVEWGTPKNKIVLGGSLRIKQGRTATYDENGPIFVPLSADLETAKQQLEAAYELAGAGYEIRVKEHPMYPMEFKETENLMRTDKPMPEQQGISVVLFTTGTSGLEAVLAGIPTVRVLLDDRISVNILPDSVSVPSVVQKEVMSFVEGQPSGFFVKWDQILAPVEMSVWKSVFDPH